VHHWVAVSANDDILSVSKISRDRQLALWKVLARLGDTVDCAGN
jgi:hypothetical protein